MSPLLITSPGIEFIKKFYGPFISLKAIRVKILSRVWITAIAGQSLIPAGHYKINLKKLLNNALVVITDMPKLWPEIIKFSNISIDRSRVLPSFFRNLTNRATEVIHILIDFFVL